MAKKIYLADDEQDIREILTEFLSNAGYEVTAYKNGDTLFSAFQEKPCDLVILDIMMPGSDGLSICKKLRTISSVPIIILIIYELLIFMMISFKNKLLFFFRLQLSQLTGFVRLF